MTIAIHVNAGAGALLTAADSQVTYYPGGQIVGQGKIASCWRSEPLGAICITGSGDPLYVGALAQDILRRFRDFQGNANQWEAEVRSAVVEFYTQHVLPHEGRLQDDNLPNYDLLIASDHTHTKKLWKAAGDVVLEASTFDCVGVGNPTAAALLGKFYPLYPTLENIAVLASYAIYRVKASVEGCGLETEIRFTNGAYPGIVPTEIIERWESLFRRYDAIERHILYHALGFIERPDMPPLPPHLASAGELPPQMSPLPEVVQEIEALKSEFRSIHFLPQH